LFFLTPIPTQATDSTWDDCKTKAVSEHSNMFVMEWPAGHETLNHASCGHMDTLAHGNYHDAGHNGNGRAPDSDCMSEVDGASHALGGPWRFAAYAPSEEATCLQVRKTPSWPRSWANSNLP
jgi:hypothetical protein